MEGHFKVSGLDCAEEVAILKKVLGNHPGILALSFEVLRGKMNVTYDPKRIDSSQIEALVASTGMRALPWDERASQQPSLKERVRLWLTIFSALFLVFALALSFYPTLSKILYGLSILSSLWFVIPRAYYSVKRVHLDMNVLMLVAIIGALFIGEWLEGATVGFLFSVALYLEQWSVHRARRAVEALVDLSPTLASVLKEGRLEERGVEEVDPGEIILIRPGEKIPLDGIVVKGISSVDQSTITGESIPAVKEVGDEVFAGTLNEEGVLECRVTKPYQETTLAKVIHLVEEARSKRAPSEQWVERFAKWYTPLMFALSLAIMVLPPLFLGLTWFDWIYRGLVLLVIACPCALVISTPVSIVAGLTRAARAGVLIKGGSFLEEIGRARALALDKTGTLTFGHPEVQQIVPMNNHTRGELLERAAALEFGSEHPLARAILRKAQEEGVGGERAEQFQSVKGKGARGFFRGKPFWIGSHRFMHEVGQETEVIHNQALKLEDAGHSVIALGTDDHVCGLISVADSPRPLIRETIEALKGLGIGPIVMLTGDNEPTAAALADHCGIERFYSELLPEDKVEAVAELRAECGSVVMIGDGVNDAPALAAASIGIAMGGMGTDAAIETADIALMSDDLSKVPWLIIHSRRVLRIIKQNTGFALGVKALFIGLALFDWTTLWMAIAADTGATLLVISNSLRLLGVEGGRKHL